MQQEQEQEQIQLQRSLSGPARLETSRYIDLKENFIVKSDSTDKTIFGLGHFELEPDYGNIDVSGHVSYLTIPNKTVNKRTAVMVVDPLSYTVYILKHASDSFWTEETEEEQKIKIRNMLDKESRFNLFPSDAPFIVSLDVPTRMSMKTYYMAYHTDNLPMFFLSQSTGNLINELVSILPAGSKSNYTLIETLNDDCVTTTIRNPVDPNDIIRFDGCPGTVVCIENHIQHHSQPYHFEKKPVIPRSIVDIPNVMRSMRFASMQQQPPEPLEDLAPASSQSASAFESHPPPPPLPDVDRTVGNNRIGNAKANTEIRKLNRSQYIRMPSEILESFKLRIVQNPELCRIITFSPEEYKSMIHSKFHSLTLKKYLSSGRSKEIGGYKKGRKSKKSRKSRKSKKSKKSRKSRKSKKSRK